MLTLLILALYALDLEPRPVGRSLTLWKFLGDEYGYSDGLWVWRSREYGRRTRERDGLVFHYDVIAGVANTVRCTRASDGVRVFFVERWLDKPGEWKWRLEVDSPGEAWPDDAHPYVFRAFGLTRSSLFGCYAAPRLVIVSQSGGLGTTCVPYSNTKAPRPLPVPTPFVVEGTEADVFWALFERYDLEPATTDSVPDRSDGTRPSLPRAGYPHYAPFPTHLLPKTVDHRARTFN